MGEEEGGVVIDVVFVIVFVVVVLVVVVLFDKFSVSKTNLQPAKETIEFGKSCFGISNGIGILFSVGCSEGILIKLFLGFFVGIFGT